MMTKMKNALALLACAVGYTTFAATPTAVWDGDFSFAKQNGYTLSLKSGGDLPTAAGALSLAADVLKIDKDTGSSSGKGAIVIKYSGYTANSLANTALASVYPSNRTPDVGAEANGGYLKSYWGTAVNRSPSTQIGSYSTSDVSVPAAGYLIVAFNTATGTSMFIADRAKSEWKGGYDSGIKWTTGTSTISGYAVGGPRNDSPASTMGPCATMTVEAVAVFEDYNGLTRDGVEGLMEYNFPNKNDAYGAVWSNIGDTTTSGVATSLNGGTYTTFKINLNKTENLSHKEFGSKGTVKLSKIRLFRRQGSYSDTAPKLTITQGDKEFTSSSEATVANQCIYGPDWPTTSGNKYTMTAFDAMFTSDVTLDASEDFTITFASTQIAMIQPAAPGAYSSATSAYSPAIQVIGDYVETPARVVSYSVAQCWGGSTTGILSGESYLTMIGNIPLAAWSQPVTDASDVELISGGYGSTLTISKYWDGTAAQTFTDVSNFKVRAHITGGTNLYGPSGSPTTFNDFRTAVNQALNCNNADNDFEITNIPFDFYDAIVYFAGGNKKGTTYTMNAVQVNGGSYYKPNSTTPGDNTISSSSSTWGDSTTSDLIYGKNVMRIDNLSSATLTLKQSCAAYGIAAIQLVERKVNSYTATVAENTDFSKLVWTPSKPKDGFEINAALTINNTAAATVTFDEAVTVGTVKIANESGHALSLVSNEMVSANWDFTDAAGGLSCESVDGNELAKYAVVGAPYSYWVVKGSVSGTPTVKRPSVPSGYSISYETLEKYGVRLIVTAPDKAKFGSVNINFMGNTSKATTDDNAKVGSLETEVGGYPVVGTSWNDLEGKNQTDTTVSKYVKADGTVVEDASIRLTATGVNNTYGSGAANNMLITGYIDDGGNPVVTITNIPFAQYRVILYRATDTSSTTFSAAQIGTTSSDAKIYYGPTSGDTTGGATAVGSTERVWGKSDARTGYTEGVNYLVSDVLEGTAGEATAYIYSHKHEGRAGVAAIQIIEVGQTTSSDAYTATVSENKKFSELVWTPTRPTEGFSAESTLTIKNTAAATLTFDETVEVSKIVVLNEEGHALTVVSGEQASAKWDFSSAEGGLSCESLVAADLTKYAVTGVPYSYWVVRGAITGEPTVACPEMPEGYTVKSEVLPNFGIRLVVEAPISAMFGAVSINMEGASDSDLDASTSYGLYPQLGSEWGVINSSTAVEKSGVTFTPYASDDNFETENGVNASKTDATRIMRGLVKDVSDEREIGVTATGVTTGVGAEYRVIVYLSTDSGNCFFAPVTINGVTYTGPTEGSSTIGYTVKNSTASRWGSTGGNGSTHPVTEGVNAVVSDVLSADTVEIRATRAWSSLSSRASIAAVQIVEVGRSVTVQKFTATINSNTNFSDIVWDQGPLVESPENEAIVTLANGVDEVVLTFDNPAVELSTLQIVGSRDVKFVATTNLWKVTSFDISACTGGITYGWPVSELAASTDTRFSYEGGTVGDVTVGIDYGSTEGAVLNLVGGTYNLSETHGDVKTSVNITNSTINYAGCFGMGKCDYIVSGSSVFNANQFVLGQGSGNDGSFTLKDTATVNVSGTTIEDTNQNSVMFGHWAANTVFTIQDEAAFNAPNTQILVGKTALNQTLNLNGGTVTTKGICTSGNATGTNTLNLNGGSLKLGEIGITHYGSTTLQINVTGDSTITAMDSMAITEPISLAAGQTLTLDTHGHSVTNSGAITGEGLLYLTNRTGLASAIYLGESRPTFAALAVEEIVLVVTDAELLSGQTVLTLADENVEVKPQDFELYDIAGNAVTVASSAKSGATFTFTLDTIPPITPSSESSLVSDAIGSRTTGTLLIQGSDDGTANAVFDCEVPAGILIRVAGKVALSVADPITQLPGRIEVLSGAEVTATAPFDATLTLASNSTLILDAGSGSLTVPNSIAGAGAVITKGNINIQASNSFTGGLTVKSGTITTTTGPGYGKSGSGSVVVEDGACVDLANTVDHSYSFTIAGKGVATTTSGETTYSGALKNTGSAIGDGKKQTNQIILSADALITVDNDWGLLGSGYGETKLDLAGYTLTKRGAASFWFFNVKPTAGTFVVEEGTVKIDKNGTKLSALNLVIADKAKLELSVDVSAIGSLTFSAGNSGVTFTGISHLAETIRPSLNAAYVDVTKLSVGKSLTLVKDPEAGITNGLFAVNLGSRFTTPVTVTDEEVKTTVKTPSNFFHYDFNNSEASASSSAAGDSLYQASSWGDKSGSGPFIVRKGRNGNSAHIFYTDGSNRLVPYWNDNTGSLSPFFAGAFTVTTVARLDGASSKPIIWSFGGKGDSGIGVAAVDATTVAAFSWKNGTVTELVRVSNIKNLKTSFHFIGLVVDGTATKLYVDRKSAVTGPAPHVDVNCKGQFGSINGGQLSPYNCADKTGFYLDDWRVYDAALTPSEMNVLRRELTPDRTLMIIR